MFKKIRNLFSKQTFFVRDGINTYKAAWTDWSAQKAINLGYSSSAIVYAAVEKRASLIAQTPFIVEVLNSNNEWEADKNHWVQRFLE